MPAAPIISIRPEHFISASSGLSDDSDELGLDDWVSVTASSTTSTSSTLPAYLVLKPRNNTKADAKIGDSKGTSSINELFFTPKSSLLAEIKSRPALKPLPDRAPPDPRYSCFSTDRSSPSSSSPPPPPPPPPSLPSVNSSTPSSQLRDVRDVRKAPKLRRITTHSVSSRHRSTAGTVPSPIDLLKRHIPTLKAIYIVNNPKLSRFHAYPVLGTIPTTGERQLFTSFRKIANPPIELNVASASECYLQVCAKCANPNLVLYCDGTWKKDRYGVCEQHRSLLNGIGKGTTNCACKGKCCGPLAELRSEATIEGESEKVLDMEVFDIVLNALQPFARQDSEQKGVRIFDMAVSCTPETHTHRDECECEEYEQ